MTNDKRPNKLIDEKSPYLLQHAYNPVDWFPWGEEAFEKANREDKPVFLSIGYSTCHWCHVMERESFEDAEVADALNANFVSIKVDREERPDIDTVYMRVCQAMTGQGGWPLTVFLTPDKTAFFAGTYFPKNAHYGRNGLLDILSAISNLWRSDKDKAIQLGTEIAGKLDARLDTPGGEFTKKDVQDAVTSFEQIFDEKYGGFGQAPKFPMAHNIMFLLRHNAYEHQDKSLNMATVTLRRMIRGGLFDHIGGGFSRYSTDNRWLVPHFEKMLYDNALLTIAYLEAYQLTGTTLFKQVSEKTLAYIQREMTAPEGGFYSAQDADSDGEEGAYYVFTPETLKDILGDDDGSYFSQWFGITEQGNFEGASIPNLLDNDQYDTPDVRIESLLPKVYEYRLGRIKLFKDDKILTAWNALMIAAYAKAYQTLGVSGYRTAAERAAKFLVQTLTRPDGRLYVRYRGGEAAGTGYLEDYAFAAWAMLGLYEATFDVSYLEIAIGHAETLCELFEDKQSGGFYQYAEDSETLMFRPKETYDGALPSGNSVAAEVLARLAQLTAEEKWEVRAQRQLAFLVGSVKEYPAAHTVALIAAMRDMYPSKQVVCAAGNDEDIALLKKALSQEFLPNVSILVKSTGNEARVNSLAPFAQTYPVEDNKTLYYLCENKTCDVPFTGTDQMITRLKD